jgi:hypothetical protein
MAGRDPDETIDYRASVPFFCMHLACLPAIRTGASTVAVVNSRSAGRVRWRCGKARSGKRHITGATMDFPIPRRMSTLL